LQPALAHAGELLRRGDQLADQQEYSTALISYKQAYEQILPGLRRLKFRREVAPRIMKRPQLQQYLAAEFAKAMSAQERRFLDQTVKAFGFAPAEMDVPAMLLALFTEQVAGFYNSETKEMFLITEEPRPPGLFSRWFGANEFDKDGQKTTLSHEMAHALADQHFNLQALDGAVKDCEDAELALSALVEGEATLVMIGEMMRGNGDDSQRVLRMRPERVDRLFSIMGVASFLGGGRAMRAAPPFFRQSLVFPYHQGTVFVARLANEGGWARIDRAFQFPPLSTEQVLHPEKYLDLANRDDPQSIRLPELPQLADWSRLGDETLGEYQTRLLLKNTPDAAGAAAGWDGDRYAVFTKDKRTALVWLTTWDSPGDSQQFLDTLLVHSAKRLRAGEDLQATQRGDGSWQIVGGLRPHYSQRRGADVAVVEGLPAETAAGVLQRLFDAERSPLHWPRGDSESGPRLPPVEAP
jgi:hypothetical protein